MPWEINIHWHITIFIHLQELDAKVAELQEEANDSQRERNFYLEKLQDIEMICTEREKEKIEPLIMIMKILYAKEVRDIKVNWKFILIILCYISIWTCMCTCAYPYHIKTGLNLGSVSINLYTCV